MNTIATTHHASHAAAHTSSNTSTHTASHTASNLASASRVDLRSDTVTRPSAGMREAMAKALVGDDVFGDDPSVNELQEKVAQMLGFEAAIFMSTGTQSNLCGILSHCQRGDEYIVGQMAHCYRWEGGGAAVFGSVQPQPLTQQPECNSIVRRCQAHA